MENSSVELGVNFSYAYTSDILKTMLCVYVKKAWISLFLNSVRVDDLNEFENKIIKNRKSGTMQLSANTRKGSAFNEPSSILWIT